MSVAAVIGMSAAYTKAQRQTVTQPDVLDNASTSQLNLAPTAPSGNQTATAPQPHFQQPQNRVVQIPVPEAAPATGGNVPQYQAPAQQSSGSH